MLAELKEIFNIVKEFCIDNYIELLLCVNTVALIWAAICLIRIMRGKKKAAVSADSAEDLLLSLNIKRADVNIGSINEDFERKLMAESAESTKDGTDELAKACANGVEADADAERKETQDKDKADNPTDAGAVVVIEKLIPTAAEKVKTAGFCTSRNGKVYSEEEILQQIKD